MLEAKNYTPKCLEHSDFFCNLVAYIQYLQNGVYSRNKHTITILIYHINKWQQKMLLLKTRTSNPTLSGNLALNGSPGKCCREADKDNITRSITHVYKSKQEKDSTSVRGS
ncbi:hypothetical protein Dimus_000204 [Dionaea muscipula]